MEFRVQLEYKLGDRMELGDLVEVLSLSGKPYRSFGGLSASVAVGDRGQVVEVFGSDYRIVSTNSNGELVWEANFAAEELRPVENQ